MKQLITQFMKFGIVGGIAFCIDFGLFLLLSNVFGVYYLVASAISFILSTCFNFMASMRYVFAGKEGQTRIEQFLIFFTLSVVGLIINQIILWCCVDVFFIVSWIGKLIATFLVMIYNFITRKLFLEDHKHAPKDSD